MLFFFIFALTFHKCQCVKKASLLIFFGLFFKWGSFLALGAGRRAAFFYPSGFLCAFLFVQRFVSYSQREGGGKLTDPLAG